MLSDLLIMASIWFPLFSILIMLVKWNKYERMNRKLMFLGIELIIIGAADIVASMDLPKIASFLWIYLLFGGLYAAMLLKRTGRLELSFCFPAAALMVFVAADLWELPVFVYGHLHIFNPVFQLWAGQWFDQIHRFYALGVLAALLILIKWKPTVKSCAFMFDAIIAPFIVLAVSPFPFWPDLARISTLVLFGCAIILGVEKYEKDEKNHSELGV
ncbi:MAG: hypothetical protein MUP17_09455 [candidate division Zixibacteria bacterium]|nr:hypothetical protein [candidate division Zixibacteria bacterium]